MPIIAPEIGCITSIVPGGAGLLYDPSDSKGLIESMNNSRSNDIDMIQQQNMAQARTLCWNNSASNYYDIYEYLYKSDSRQPA
jgi:hypothetical protein